MSDGWVSQDAIRDGSGFYRCGPHVYRIVVQDLISARHRVAYLDGREVARAATFATLVRKLRKLRDEATA